MKAVTRASSAVSSSISASTEPIRNSTAYKALTEAVVEALDDSGSSRHAGFEEKEARRERRRQRLLKAGLSEGGLAGRAARTPANPSAGSSVVLHEDAISQEKWETLKAKNPLFRTMASLRQSFESSEHPIVSGMRSMSETVSSWFDENEMAKVIRMMRVLDPGFQMDVFQRELREYIIPEVVDAYLSADKEALQTWCGEATFNVLWATIDQYLRQGLVSDSKVLDIRHVEITTGKLLENEIPVFVVTFATQELLLFRNALTREIVIGAEDKVEQCHYAAVITRGESELDNELTGGWKIVEMARRSARSFL